jgi:hypothetical protein
MTGERASFKELDEVVCGNIKFGDRSVVQIMGHDTMAFRNEDHIARSGAASSASGSWTSTHATSESSTAS